MIAVALIALGFVVIGIWSWVDRLDHEERRPEETRRLIKELQRHKETE